MYPPRPAYIDDTGTPCLRPSIVGFLDLLGFSNHVMNAADPVQAGQLLDRIVSAIQDSRRHVRQSLAEDFSLNPDGWAVKFFSDNLVLGYDYGTGDGRIESAARFIIRCTQQYQLRMTLNGMFLRGALTHGPVCMTDEIIFGSALIECYLLESKTAIVPRVILSKALERIVLAEFTANSGKPMEDMTGAICRDIDGWWFVNYLQAAVQQSRVDWAMIETHKTSILNSIQSSTRHDVLPKFGWATRYHNLFCHWHREDPGYSSRYRIDRHDEQSTISRLGEVPFPD